MRVSKTQRPRFHVALSGWAALLLPGVLLGRPVPNERTVLPEPQVRELAPLLATADLALLESDPRGAMRQISIFTWVAAPAPLVRDVLMEPERYTEFVRNLVVSRATRLPDGTVDHNYGLSYSLVTVEGHSHFVALPATTSGTLSINMFDPDPAALRWHRWDLLPTAGGTVLVLSGYTDVLHSGGIIDRLLQSVPTLEYGLALMAQMTLALAMKGRAEQLALERRLRPPPPSGRTPGYAFLLDRGVLSLLRSRQGRLQEMSLTSRSRARPEALLQSAGHPERWAGSIPSITRSIDLGLQHGMPVVELEQSLPLMSFRTTLGLHRAGTAVDMLGVAGDLRGGRLRWDVRPAPGGSEIVLRTRLAFDRASLVLRQLYKLEPLFEYGVNTGLGLVLLWGVMAQAGDR